MATIIRLHQAVLSTRVLLTLPWWTSIPDQPIICANDLAADLTDGQIGHARPLITAIREEDIFEELVVILPGLSEAIGASLVGCTDEDGLRRKSLKEDLE